MFKQLKLKKTYSSIEDKITDDLLIPVLSNAIKYDRAVGFFSSSWLKEVASGLAVFATSGGKARIVTSVKLSQKDWEALKLGALSDKNINEIIDNQVCIAVNELKKLLETKTLATLSWMISENILEFKFALPIGKLHGGIFHTKLSLLYDLNNDGIAI